MSGQILLPNDDPIMTAWKTYKSTDAYANARRWAFHHEHVDGSLWIAFVMGWNAALSSIPRKENK